MGHPKPYHRNVRGFIPAKNAGYSSRQYILDPEYAKNAEHYVRAFMLIQNDLESIFEYLEPSDESLKAYSYRIHALLMRTCIEVEANFKAILKENTFRNPGGASLNIHLYRKVDVTHHLSSYEVMLPIWNGAAGLWAPFAPWKIARGLSNVSGVRLPWYQAYNASKHDRQDQFKEANFGHLVEAVAALLVLISAQFAKESFSAGLTGLAIGGSERHPMEAATGSLFRIKYPDDWSDDELYDFDWSVLKSEPDRFQKLDYDTIPF